MEAIEVLQVARLALVIVEEPFVEGLFVEESFVGEPSVVWAGIPWLIDETLVLMVSRTVLERHPLGDVCLVAIEVVNGCSWSALNIGRHGLPLDPECCPSEPSVFHHSAVAHLLALKRIVERLECGPHGRSMAETMAMVVSMSMGRSVLQGDDWPFWKDGQRKQDPETKATAF